MSVYYVFIIIQYHMILFFARPQNFVISFMDKPPTLILMRWIFGALGQGNSTQLSGFGRDPFNQNVRKFRSKTQWIGSVQPEKFRKNWSTFWGGPPFPVGQVWILVEWIAPFVYHKFWQNFWLGPPEVAFQQSKGRAKPTQDSSMSKQTTKPLFLEPTALWKLWPQWVTVPFHNCNI